MIEELGECVMNLSENELRHLCDLLEIAGDKFSNHGCNDYLVPDTPENRRLYEEMGAANCGMTVEAYLKSDEFYEPASHGGQIYLMDWALMGYLRRKIQQGIEARCG